MYQPYDGERELSYAVGLWDDKTQRESLLTFDYLDAAVRLRRTLPEAEFPIFRRHLVEALREAAQKDSPGSPLARVASLGKLGGGEQLKQYLRHAQDGDLMSAVILAMACGEKVELGCRDGRGGRAAALRGEAPCDGADRAGLRLCAARRVDRRHRQGARADRTGGPAPRRPAGKA